MLTAFLGNAAQAQQTNVIDARNAMTASAASASTLLSDHSAAGGSVADDAPQTGNADADRHRPPFGAGSSTMAPPNLGAAGSSDCTSSTGRTTTTGAGGFAMAPCAASPADGNGAPPSSTSPTLEQASYNQAVLAANDGLPQSQLGLGKVDPGMDELDIALRPQQVFSDLRTLEDQLNVGDRPVANAVARFSSQSDHLDIRQEEVSQDIYFSQGRSQLRLGAQALRYLPDQGFGIRQRAAGFTGNYRISDEVAIAGEYWFNWITADHNVHSTNSTYDLFLTLWPSDYVRIDIDTNGRTFDNVRSLELGIIARTAGASIDYMPTDRLRVTVRGHGGFYSDGNHRQLGELEAVWRALSTPRIDVGVLATAFHYDRLLNNGYFNPRNYQSGEATARLQQDVGKRLTLELAGSAGIENANPDGTKPLVKASLQARYKLVRNWSLDGAVSHFSSRTSTSSGFSRTSFVLGLHLRF